MLTNSDFRELLKRFEKHKIRYLVVGAYAVMKYSEPRFTKDLDLWIATDPENANSVYVALKEFGAPLANLMPDDFTRQDCFYQMGIAPLRVDIMMSIPGVEFEEAWKNREVVELDNLKIPFIYPIRPGIQEKPVHRTSRFLICRAFAEEYVQTHRRSFGIDRFHGVKKSFSAPPEGKVSQPLGQGCR